MPDPAPAPDDELPDLRGLRALVISQPTTHGVAAVVRDQMRAAIAAGASVVAATPATGTLPAWSREVGAQWQPIDLRRAATAADLLRVAELRRLARGFDLVHLHSSKAGADGRLALATLRHRPPTIFTPHAWSWLVGGRLEPAYRAFERATVSLADVIVAVSHEEREEGLRVLGSKARDRVRVIENGVDTDHFRPDGERAVASEAPLLVCVGRLTEQKGQSVLVEALAASHHTEARVALVGDGEDRVHLEALVARRGLGERVDFVGEVSDPAPWFRAATLVVAPSRWDGMAVALLEAMACGAPIVATEVAGTSAIADVGETVPVEAPAALAAAIDALLDDQSRRERMGAQARVRALERYTLRRSLAATVGLWAEVTS